MNKMCNKENGGTHITIFASLSNASGIIPDLYSFRIVDKFGIFIPTFFGSIASFFVLLLIKPLVNLLSEAKREDFDVNSGYEPVKSGKKD